MNRRPLKPAAAPKRAVLYARVSTEEQNKSNYPSCESQIEQLEKASRSRGWTEFEVIKDEGISAGTLRRPGMARMRALVRSGEIGAIFCTYYDRLTRSREFYVLDAEFKTHGVEFITIHDPTDTTTASGRFVEMMLVAAKTYEREQTGEKVRTKMRQRAEKGMGNGGLVPFGFVRDRVTHILSPDPDKLPLVVQLFQTYVDSASDCVVRDWLKAHQVASPHGKEIWPKSSIRDLLCNRRYIGEIEINKKSKGLDGLPDADAYCIVPAPHQPLVPRELFELAQAVRQDKGLSSPNRRGRPRSYSQNECGRVYPLQGRLVCAQCGHSMAPTYTKHKPRYQRTCDSYNFYYICAQQQMSGRKGCDHSNRVSAPTVEAWLLKTMEGLVRNGQIIEKALEIAHGKCHQDLQPQRDALSLTQTALRENQGQIDEIIATISGGNARGGLIELLNERADQLKIERERLRIEQRRLTEALTPLSDYFDPLEMRGILTDFTLLVREATPEELQRLIRLIVRRVEWTPDDDGHWVEFYPIRKTRHGLGPHLDNRFEINERSSGPDRIRTGDLLRDRQTC